MKYKLSTLRGKCRLNEKTIENGYYYLDVSERTVAKPGIASHSDSQTEYITTSIINRIY